MDDKDKEEIPNTPIPGAAEPGGLDAPENSPDLPSTTKRRSSLFRRGSNTPKRRPSASEILSQRRLSTLGGNKNELGKEGRALDILFDDIKIQYSDTKEDKRSLVTINGIHNEAHNEGINLYLTKEQVIDLSKDMQQFLGEPVKGLPVGNADIAFEEFNRLSRKLKESTPENNPHNDNVMDHMKRLEAFNEKMNQKLKAIQAQNIEQVYTIDRRASTKTVVGSDVVASSSSTLNAGMQFLKNIPVIGAIANVMWLGASAVAEIFNRKQGKVSGYDAHRKRSSAKNILNGLGSIAGLVAVFVAAPIAGLVAGLLWTAGELLNPDYKTKLGKTSMGTAVAGSVAGLAGASMVFVASLGIAGISAATFGIVPLVCGVVAAAFWVASGVTSWVKQRREAKAAKLDMLSSLDEGTSNEHKKGAENDVDNKPKPGLTTDAGNIMGMFDKPETTPPDMMSKFANALEAAEELKEEEHALPEPAPIEGVSVLQRRTQLPPLAPAEQEKARAMAKVAEAELTAAGKAKAAFAGPLAESAPQPGHRRLLT